MDVDAVLIDVLVVLVAAKVAAEVSERVGVPAVVGEIVAGVLVGPTVLGLVAPGDVLHTLAELGVILLLLQVGLETDPAGMRSVGRAAVAVALVGVVVPMAGGLGVGLALGLDAGTAVFVGAALTATSVGITARVLGDLRALGTAEARTVLGAAVVDDVVGLVILTVVVRAVAESGLTPGPVVSVVALALGFVVVAGLVAVRVAPPLFGVIRRHSRSAGTLVALALGFTLALAELAHAAELAPIIGAFIAGIALARTPAAERVRTEIAPVGHLLIPVFFLQIGIDADLSAVLEPGAAAMAAALLAVAVAGKLASAAGLIGTRADRLLVGIGMVPRGEVGLVFAAIGLQRGVFGQDVYGALVLVVLCTTVVTPPLLRWRYDRLRSRGPGSRDQPLLVRDGEGRLRLAGEPGRDDALATALRAARRCEREEPGDDLLAWLADLPPGPRRWDDASRAELWRLLLEGGPRSWRLLRASGVLHAALPEIDDALARRTRAAIDLDPLRALRMPRLEALQEGVRARPDGPVPSDEVLLAALVCDVCGGGPDAPAIARRTVARLGLDEATARAVAALVADRVDPGTGAARDVTADPPPAATRVRRRVTWVRWPSPSRSARTNGPR
ncbi:MAG: hypothetical protein KatS3mg009_1608 [Acidimicrobiia bacterium]|nr:MAG: hypothetical protein KatS3mg009_1608 [Acidimicrobiia bacterium]